MSDSKDEGVINRNLSRRSVLKWSGALAAAGIVGIGLGIGGDLLIRPSTTKTTTSTATGSTTTVTASGKTVSTTVTTPPTTLSYVPPLSPIVQDKVNSIIQNQVALHQGETVTYSTCGLSCMTVCLFKVHTKNGVVTSIVSDDSINPNNAREDVGLDSASKGLLQSRACALGHSWMEKVYSPLRLLYPMQAVGPKGSGQYQRITWTQALDTIYSQITQAIDQYGPYSILSEEGDGSGFYPLINASCMTWGEQSYSGDGNSELLMTGQLGWCNVTSSESDIFNSKLVLLLGRLPPVIEGQGGTWAYMTLLAKEAGIPFILIDPRYTVVHKNLNAQWIPIKPGTDVALLLAMAYQIVSQDLYDHDFVSQWMEPNGFTEWTNYLLGNGSDGIAKTPQWAEQLCGIPADTIIALANLYANSKPSKLYLGWEMNRSTSTNITRTAIALQAMMGYLLMPGGGSPTEEGYCRNPWESFPLPSAASFSGGFNVPVPPATPTLLNALKWQKAILLRPQLDSGSLTSAEYNGLIGCRSGDPSPNIKVASFCGNDVTDRYGANERILATKQPGIFTFGRLWYFDASAPYMDILLPNVEFALEDPGQGSRFINNWAGANNWFAYAPPAIAPQGEARPDTWTWLMLAKRAGVGKEFNEVLDGLLQQDEWDFDIYNQAFDEAHEASYEQWAALPQIAPYNPPSWDVFKQDAIWRMDAVEVPPYALWLDNGTTGCTASGLPPGTNPFAWTASQKIETSSSLLANPSIAASQYISPNSFWGNMYTNVCLGTIGPGATAIPTWVPNLEHTIYDQNSTDYPLLVISPNSYYRSHSCGFNISLLNGDCYHHRVWISVSDATARGIQDNDMVRVFSDVGEVYIPAYVTSRILPGVVAIYHGGYYDPGGIKTTLQPDGVDTTGAMNLLLKDDQPGTMTVGPDVGSGPVQIEKIAATTVTETTSSTANGANASVSARRR